MPSDSYLENMRSLKTAIYRLNELIEDRKTPEDTEWVFKQFEITFDTVISVLKKELVYKAIRTRSERECLNEAIKQKMIGKNDLLKGLLSDYQALLMKPKNARKKLILENIEGNYLDLFETMQDEIESYAKKN